VVGLNLSLSMDAGVGRNVSMSMSMSMSMSSSHKTRGVRWTGVRCGCGVVSWVWAAKLCRGLDGGLVWGGEKRVRRCVRYSDFLVGVHAPGRSDLYTFGLMCILGFCADTFMFAQSVSTTPPTHVLNRSRHQSLHMMHRLAQQDSAGST
jgi:hypothetical protein